MSYASTAVSEPLAQKIGSGLLKGTIVVRPLECDPSQWYYAYIPRSLHQASPVLVAVHGITRNADVHARMLAPMAERQGAILIAPLFDRTRQPAYQRLAETKEGQRSDQLLIRILDEVTRLAEVGGAKIHLFGYSGGGQFAHRFAFAHPERVEALVIGAAGWYTFPDPLQAYPLGLAQAGALRFEPHRFLRIPTSVLVGDLDTERDARLNQDPLIDRQQGLNRVERGKKWIETMRSTAQNFGFNTPYKFALLPGVGHSFERSVRKAFLASRIGAAFWGNPPGPFSGPSD